MYALAPFRSCIHTVHLFVQAWRCVVDCPRGLGIAIRPCDSSPPRNLAEGARCPQAFSRLQDSRFYCTSNHYQNVINCSARYVCSCIHKLIQYLTLESTICFELLVPAEYQRDLSALKVLAVPSRHEYSNAYTQCRPILASILTLVLKTKPHIAWTTALHLLRKSRL
jgi:hypothetical protein